MNSTSVVSGVKTQFYVFSQKGWLSPTIRSTPLQKDLAYKIRNNLLDKGYRHVVVIQVITPSAV